MRIVRLWKHLHLLKRGGIGLLSEGVNSAEQGSCAVECPACPLPQDQLTNRVVNADEHPARTNSNDGNLGTGETGDSSDTDHSAEYVSNSLEFIPLTIIS